MNQISGNEAVVVSNYAYSINAIGVVRSLSLEGVRVTWLTPDRGKWFYSKYSEPISCPDFRENAKHFIEFLLKLGKKRYANTPSVLIPTSDASLIPISENKTILEKYYHPLACDWSITEKFIDKRKTYQIGELLNVQVPKTYYPQNIEEAKRVADEISYPCLVKPALSHVFRDRFRIELVRANNVSELFKAYQFFSLKGFGMMIQEYVPGPDRNVITLNTVLNAQSQPLAIFMHRRLLQNPPEFGAVALGESTWEPDIIDAGIKFLKALGFEGIAQIEFKQDSRTGEFKLIEVNARSYLSISLPTACGLNLIHVAYRNAKGEKLEQLTKYSCIYKCGIKWVDLPACVDSLIRSKGTKNVSFKRFVQSLFGNKVVPATFSVNDSSPFLMEIVSILLTMPAMARTLFCT